MVNLFFNQHFSDLIETIHYFMTSSGLGTFLADWYVSHYETQIDDNCALIEGPNIIPKDLQSKVTKNDIDVKL